MATASSASKDADDFEDFDDFDDELTTETDSTQLVAAATSFDDRFDDRFSALRRGRSITAAGGISAGGGGCRATSLATEEALDFDLR